MTPGARLAAAIDILDAILAGDPAEKALTAWARKSRFAGSKDRAAVRDHVFDCLRNLDTFQALSGISSCGVSGRSLLIGYVRQAGLPIHDLFDGKGYNPAPLTDTEMALQSDLSWQSNLPAWVFENLTQQLGAETARQQAEYLANRAPVTLRVNLRRSDRKSVRESLAQSGIETVENPLSASALTVLGSAKGLAGTQAFLSGLFEMQDAASQAVVDALPLADCASVLDFCAGGGGKTLAIAALSDAAITAHDLSTGRLNAAKERAERAGAAVNLCSDPKALPSGGFDLVLLDAPCSGSGSWRRAPDAKRLFTQGKLAELVATQREILSQTQSLVAPSGCLAYVTCSIFENENEIQRRWFLDQHPSWESVQEQKWLVSPDGDGFFLSLFRRTSL